MRNVVLLLTCIVLVNCSYFKQPKPAQQRYDFQDEAGSIFVGVQSVAPFEAYVDALQPRFTLTTEEALKSALATTQIQELRELRALLLSIAVNLPTQAVSISEERKRTGGETTSARTETTTETSGAVPTTAVPTKLEDILEQLEDATNTISLDASLNYRAAAALLQEVALLSNYVRDAAVGSGSAPYVVRMLITVFPAARKSPYDVYTNISFFGDRGRRPFVYNRDLDLPPNMNAKLETDIEDCVGRPLRTIPLFVTDNLETSVLRSSRGAVADLGGTVGGSIGSAGAGAGGRVQNESTAASLGRGINALFTLGLASENTLAVRLGAVKSDTGYEMLPRTYNLTALVLVPTVSLADARSYLPIVYRKENEAEIYADRTEVLDWLSKNAVFDQDLLVLCTSVNFRSHSIFRDAENGTTPVSRQQQPIKDELRSLLGVDDGRMLDALLRDDFTSFKRAYNEINRGMLLGDSPENYWVAAVAARSRRGFAGGSFDVPRTFLRIFNSSVQDVAVYDDGKTAVMQLSGAVGLVSKGLSGKLVAKGGSHTWTVYSSSATATNDGTGARIEFPSVEQAAKAANLELKNIEVAVEVIYSPPLQRWDSPTNTFARWAQAKTPVVKIDPKPAPVAFSLLSNTSHIRAKSDGTGQLRIEVKTLDKNIAVPEVRFSVEGGVMGFGDVSPPGKQDGADLVLATNQSYTINVSNLIPGNTLRLKAWRMDGTNKIEAPVVPVAVYELAGGAPKKE